MGMFIKSNALVVLLLAFLATTGCATAQKPISFNLNPDANRTIGIVQVEAPVPAAQYTGSIGLLDLAIIATANSGLNAHLKTQKFDGDYKELPKNLKTILENKGYKVVLIDKSIDIKAASKYKEYKNGVNTNDFSKYKTEHGVADLLLLNMSAVGTTRSYYGPVPLTEPTANVVIRGAIINLDNNKLEWLTTANSSKVIEKPWDESAKKWPNLTNAIYTAVNESTKLIQTEIENPELVNKTAAK
ncbi:MAG TPA: hypothetical protein VN030_04475 [Cellvibrio sp.]|nr:hypothetical protein [Cellvibrio sp.]